MKKRDAAVTIAQNVSPTQIINGDRSEFEREMWLLERRIRMAITSAVRKERERCVGAVWVIRCHELRTHSTRVGAFVADDIIKAINAPATKPGKRKGKR